MGIDKAVLRREVVSHGKTEPFLLHLEAAAIFFVELYGR